MKQLLTSIFLLISLHSFSQGDIGLVSLDPIVIHAPDGFEIRTTESPGSFPDGIEIGQSDLKHAGRVIIQRFKADDLDAARFSWGTIHSLDYGRAQIDKVVPMTWVPNLKDIVEELRRAAYRQDSGEHIFISPENARYGGHVDAVTAFQEGNSPVSGHYRYLDYEWCYDIWEYQGKTYSVSSALREDGQFFVSYATYFKK